MNLGRHSTLSSLSKAMASKVTSVADFFFFTSRESLRREKMAREADDEREAESTFD